MDKEIRILIIEDSEADVELLARQLDQCGLAYTLKWVKTKEAFQKLIGDYIPDMIFSDFNMPGFGASEALEIAKEVFPGIPFAVISGTIAEDRAVEMMKAGAVDYIMKDRLYKLAEVIKRAVREREVRVDLKKAEAEIRQSAEQWKMTFDAMSEMIFVQDKDMNIVRINKACLNALKMDSRDVIGKKCFEIVHHLDHPWLSCPFKKSELDKESHTEEVIDPRLGIILQVTVAPILGIDGEWLGAVHVARDITQEKKVTKQTEAHLHELEIYYKASMGREERILALKEEIDQLKEDLAKFKKSV